MVEDHVVGAAGIAPNIIDTASVQSDLPFVFDALTRIQYFSPPPRPVRTYRGPVMLFIVVDAFDIPKYSRFVAYSNSYVSALVDYVQFKVKDVPDNALISLILSGLLGFVCTLLE